MGEDASITMVEMEARLATSMQALRLAEERATAGRLALEVMHEIRNPLEALGHLTYLACEEAHDSGKVRQYMTLAEEQLATLHQISGQTLGFARTSAKPRACELCKLAEAALRIHRRTIESKKIHLIKNLPADLVAEVFPGEILQVLSNLIVNALDAMDNEGQLSLRIRRRGGSIQIAIVDNGHGIAAEHGQRIFEPFYTTKGDKGTGLGLSLSKNIVERHKGKLSMRSSVRSGCAGTLFRISLPAA